MPTCRQVALEVSTGSVEDAPLLRRLQVHLHLLMCRSCRSYARQLRRLGRHFRAEHADPTGDREAVERIARVVLEAAEKSTPTPPASSQ